LTIDNAVYLVDLFGTQKWESFLYFEYFQCVDRWFGGLSVRLARVVEFALYLVFNCGFLGLEILGNNVDLFL